MDYILDKVKRLPNDAGVYIRKDKDENVIYEKYLKGKCVMPNEMDIGAVMPRRVMTLFLLVDTSGSMTVNGNIGRVNSAIEEMVPLLQEVSDENADAEIKVAVLAFSSGCRWVTRNASGQAGAESLETFFWNDLEASGLTDMGAAFAELESKLSRNAFLASSTGAYAPVIILLSDGQPTDSWQAGLDKLKRNNWYRCATKIAISVDNGDTSVLTAFTGTSESVLQVNSGREDLKSLLCRLAVVSSTMQSRSISAASGGTDSEEAQNRAIEAIQQTTGVTDDTNSPDTTWGEGW